MVNGSSSHTLRCRSGFSLVEILVAVGILGFILSAVLLLFINAIALNENSRNLTTAVSHVQYVLEDIRNASFATVPTQITTGTWNWDAAIVASKGLTALKSESITTTYSGAALLTVTVTVTWNDSSGRSRTSAMTTQMGGA